MTEHPILFSGEMVRAILDDRKTQTRRVIKAFPINGYKWSGWIIESGERKKIGSASIVPEKNEPCISTGQINAHCPYGEVGDRLWVRETWGETTDKMGALCGYHYRADMRDEYFGKWKPSIHMPREASRITLEITNIKVERLQDMDRAAAFLEGCPYEIAGPDGDIAAAHNWFVGLWASINDERGYGWDKNPWVWVIEFKRDERVERHG